MHKSNVAKLKKLDQSGQNLENYN